MASCSAARQGQEGGAVIECGLGVPLQSGRARDRSSVTLLSAFYTSVLPGRRRGGSAEREAHQAYCAAVAGRNGAVKGDWGGLRWIRSCITSGF